MPCTLVQGSVSEYFIFISVHHIFIALFSLAAEMAYSINRNQFNYAAIDIPTNSNVITKL